MSESATDFTTAATFTTGPPFPSLSEGPPFPTRTLHSLGGCESEGEPIPAYCERWVVPMTTQWEAPDDCPNIVPQASAAAWYLSCGPDAFEQVWYNDGYYSPGVCPSGYTVDCTATGDSMNGETIQPEETVGLCVPLGFQCSSATSSNGGDETVFWALRTTTLGSQTMSADRPALQIRWRERDLAYLPIHPLDAPDITTEITLPTSDLRTSANTFSRTHQRHTTTASETASSASESATTDGASEAGSATGSSSSSGISTGAIAGIVVGVVGFLALLGVGLWICIARRRQQKATPVAQSDPSMVQYNGNPSVYYPQHGYHPSGAPPGSYHDKTAAMAQAHMTPAFPQEAPSSPSLGIARSVQATPPAPSAHSPGLQHASIHSPTLAMGNDLETVPAVPSGGENGEAWERDQLLARQSALQDRRTRLELEQIEREERLIQQRLSQMPPQ